MKTQPPQATKHTTKGFRSDGAHLTGRAGQDGVTDRAYEDGTLDSYSKDEVDFMLAVDQYKRDHHRPFPTSSEVLSVVRSLGYRLPADATEVV